MRAKTERFGIGRGAAMALVLTGLGVLAGCNRDRLYLTECVDGRPVVERTLDVAPPNC
ncbi:hypothetical protein [Defluviimonas sp. SAOS-178_SWC]|uniref:hypothetical protein n=1 Tax=Defluviimonas sp. SAOS-178_SWC TaxID=3121287 RepID=UPI003221B86F